MEIKDKELHLVRSGSQAILTKDKCIDLYTVNCWLKAHECDRATASLIQITWIEANQKLRGIKDPGCE